MNLLSLDWWNAAGDLLVWTAIWVLCLVWLYHGGHALATRSFNRMDTVRTLAGGAFCIAIGAMNYWVHINMERLAALDQMPRVTKQLPHDWGANNPPADREKSSRIVASMAYVNSGQLFKYVDGKGTWKDYCPTSEDASRIRNNAEAIVRTSELSNQSFTNAVRTWAAGVVAFVLGFAFGHLGRHKGANPSINPDAAR